MQLFIVALLWACLASVGLAAGTELNCAVFTYGNWDYEVTTDPDTSLPTSRCIESVELARKRCGGTKLNFVTSHFWVDAEADSYVDYYCYKVDGGQCAQPTPALVADFVSGMQACFGRAIALGFNIEITPHLDDGLGKGGWRNALVFDPLERYGGSSYTEIMIKPLADALAKAVKPTTMVYFGMQGEMSATVMRYPASWQKLISDVKTWVGGRTPQGQKRVLVGVSTNFNKLCACVLMDLVDPEEYLRKLPQALEPIIGEFDLAAISSLYNSVDFIGMSNYASMPAKFLDSDLENAARQFAEEAKHFGIDLNNLVNVKKKQLHFSEYGVGGGTCQAGNCPAKTPDQVAQTPFFGIFGPYKRSTDPWQQWQPRQVNVANRDWLRSFYNRTTQWLAKEGGPAYRVDSLSMWNVASWDVVGVNADSTTTEGTYFDPIISTIIMKHNRMVATGAYPAAAPKNGTAAVKPIPRPVPKPTRKASLIAANTTAVNMNATAAVNTTAVNMNATAAVNTTAVTTNTTAGTSSGAEPQTVATPASGEPGGNGTTSAASNGTATPVAGPTATPLTAISAVNTPGGEFAGASSQASGAETSIARPAGAKSQSTGLGMAPMIGIIVGGAVLLILVAVIVGIVLLKRRNKRRAASFSRAEVMPGAPVVKVETPQAHDAHAHNEPTGPGHYI